MKRLLANSRKTIQAGLIAAGIAAMAMPVSAEPIWTPYETTAPEIGAINALMAPIQPFVGGTGSNSLINQTGSNGTATASIVGSGNLTLLQQSGANNRAVQAIQGQNSAALLYQGGNNNNVLQASVGDNNFQAVAVSGNNNDVAYLQVGNSLAGALDVRGSTNSSVFALQTPGSTNYMMPAGLTGLQNQVVVVVPGRMYVFNKNAL